MAIRRGVHLAPVGHALSARGAGSERPGALADLDRAALGRRSRRARARQAKEAARWPPRHVPAAARDARRVRRRVRGAARSAASGHPRGVLGDGTRAAVAAPPRGSDVAARARDIQALRSSRARSRDSAMASRSASAAASFFIAASRSARAAAVSSRAWSRAAVARSRSLRASSSRLSACASAVASRPVACSSSDSSFFAGLLRDPRALAELPARLRVHLALARELLGEPVHLRHRRCQLVLQHGGPRAPGRAPLGGLRGGGLRAGVAGAVRQRQLHGEVRAHGQLRFVQLRPLAGPAEGRDPLLALLRGPGLVLEHRQHAPALARRPPRRAWGAGSDGRGARTSARRPRSGRRAAHSKRSTSKVTPGAGGAGAELIWNPRARRRRGAPAR